jgi:hypothetical protein
MVQHVEECQAAEDKIRRLESEAELLASNIIWLEKLSYELQIRIQKLLEDSTLGPKHQVCRLPGLVMKITVFYTIDVL